MLVLLAGVNEIMGRSKRETYRGGICGWWSSGPKRLPLLISVSRGKYIMLKAPAHLCNCKSI